LHDSTMQLGNDMTPDMTLMIIDDSKAMRFLVTKYVQHIRPSLRVIEAESADDARAKLVTEHVDFLLIDFKMPGDDGITFIEKFRQDPSNKQKIVMLTANIQEELGGRATGLNVPCFRKPPNEEVVKDILDYYFND